MQRAVYYQCHLIYIYFVGLAGRFVLAYRDKLQVFQSNYSVIDDTVAHQSSNTFVAHEIIKKVILFKDYALLLVDTGVKVIDLGNMTLVYHLASKESNNILKDMDLISRNPPLLITISDRVASVPPYNTRVIKNPSLTFELNIDLQPRFLSGKLCHFVFRIYIQSLFQKRRTLQCYIHWG